MVSPIQSICTKNLEIAEQFSRKSEDDGESTDDGFDRFTNHQAHLSTSRQWLCL